MFIPFKWITTHLMSRPFFSVCLDYVVMSVPLLLLTVFSLYLVPLYLRARFFLLYFLYNRLLFHRYFIVRPLSIFGVYFSFCYVLSSCWLEFVSLFSYICIVCPLSLCCAPFLVRRKWFRSSCRNKIFPDLLSSEVTLFIFSSFWRTSNRHLLYFSSSTELFALRFLLFSQFYFVALVFLLRLFLSATFQCGFFYGCVYICSLFGVWNAILFVVQLILCSAFPHSLEYLPQFFSIYVLHLPQLFLARNTQIFWEFVSEVSLNGFFFLRLHICPAENSSDQKTWILTVN